MIVPMKKVWVIVRPKDADSALKKLRSLGVLHVRHEQAPQGKDINSLQDDIALINKAAEILSETEFRQKCEVQSEKASGDLKFTASHIIDLWRRLDQLKEYSQQLNRGISRWQAWGDFNPEAVRGLGEKGVLVRLYQVAAKEMRNFPKGIVLKKISSAGGMVNCVVVSKQKLDIPFKEIELPKIGLGKMRARLIENEQAIENIKRLLCEHISYIRSFARTKKLLEKDLELCLALSGMGRQEGIMYITGYIPFDAQAGLTSASKNQGWGLRITEPQEDDNVPTLIRNPAWVSIIRPMFKIIEVIPGYRELDISFWFLIFFSIFFGMLIGDAAYGIIFFILTLFAQKKWGKKIKSRAVFMLFYLLSSCAVIWGVLSGTFFGQELFSQWVRPVLPALRDAKYMQSLCFLLGAVHLSIAHAWRAIIKFPSVVFLSEIGWMLILWAAFFLAKALILGDNFPVFAKWFIVAGAACVALFSSPKKNILKGIGSGLGNLFLNLVNNFTDIVSYIRIFAVGLATVAVADATNTMAKDIGFGGITASVATAIILLIGHTVNIILGPLAVLVHGVRLNLLEFCNHLDIKWSGFAYKPLKEEPV